MSVSRHQCCKLIFVYPLLLPERQMGEDWEPSESNDLSEAEETFTLHLEG
jgi:hypothetical protein